MTRNTCDVFNLNIAKAFIKPWPFCMHLIKFVKPTGKNTPNKTAVQQWLTMEQLFLLKNWVIFTPRYDYYLWVDSAAEYCMVI